MSKEDARKHERTSLVVTVDWQVLGSEDVIWSMTGDISAGGIRVKTLTPAEEGAELEVALQITKDEEPLRVPARVAWVRLDEEFCGMGLSFQPENDEDRDRIRSLLESLKGRA